jgi:hypothetical protein
VTGVPGADHTLLAEQPNEPIRVSRVLKAVAMTEPKPGVYVYDFGQNFAGRTRFSLRAGPGATISIRHGEVLNDRPGQRLHPGHPERGGPPIPVDGRCIPTT